ncbi:CaiB/BaiF CoA-transferase family protein [soil metagenome]
MQFCGMMLSDLGAEVISIQRPRQADNIAPFSTIGLGRGRRYVSIDLRSEDGLRTALAIAGRVDAVTEGFLPGVAENLGVGPDACAAANRRLVYGRMTGWGQTGPLSSQPGHNINMLAVAGVLTHLGRADGLPVPPTNLLADGGGAMMLALGVTAALLEARTSGQGQVIDASMLDGAALLSTMSHEMRNGGLWDDERGSNLNDSGAPFYEVYETADGRLVAIGAVEDQYWNALIDLLEIHDADVDRWDRANWPWWRARIQEGLILRTQAEWSEIAEMAGVCLSPVLTMAQAADHPHNRERGVFTRAGDSVIPRSAPRFSRTYPDTSPSMPTSDDQTLEVLADLGIDINQL